MGIWAASTNRAKRSVFMELISEWREAANIISEHRVACSKVRAGEREQWSRARGDWSVRWGQQDAVLNIGQSEPQ